MSYFPWGAQTRLIKEPAGPLMHVYMLSCHQSPRGGGCSEVVYSISLTTGLTDRGFCQAHLGNIVAAADFVHSQPTSGCVPDASDGRAGEPPERGRGVPKLAQHSIHRQRGGRARRFSSGACNQLKADLELLPKASCCLAPSEETGLLSHDLSSTLTLLAP